MEYSYGALRNEAIARGAERYIYESIHEPLADPQDFEQIPEYFAEHVALANARVNKILSESFQKEAFVFFSDAHVRQNGMASVPIIRSIMQNTGVGTVIYGGDTVSAWVNEKTAVEDVRFFESAFEFANPYMVRGNHDVYGKEFEIANKGIVLSNEKVYELIFGKGKDRVVGEVGKTYYRFDHPDTKMRYIVIDTNEILTPVWTEQGVWDCDVSVSEEQIMWFVKQLHEIPNGYAAVVVGHIPMFGKLKHSNPCALIFGRLIEAYNGRYTVDGVEGADFTNACGKILLTLSGHGHYDDAYVSPDGCVNLEIHCDAMTDNGGSRYKKTRGTVTENVIDVVILNRDHGDVFCVRYGAGEDRAFYRRGK